MIVLLNDIVDRNGATPTLRFKSFFFNKINSFHFSEEKKLYDTKKKQTLKMTQKIKFILK